MNILEFSRDIDNLVDIGSQIPVTVHLGGKKWEDVVDVVFCQECTQIHIIAEDNRNSHESI